MARPNKVPIALANEVATLIKLIARDVKPQLSPSQWKTVQIMLKTLVQMSQHVIAQYHAIQYDYKNTEDKFGSFHQQLDLLEDFLEMCLINQQEAENEPRAK